MREEHKVNRREMLALAVGSGALLSVVSAAPAVTRFGFTTYQWGIDWDLKTLIANLKKAKVYGVELRTSARYAHGVELDISPERRREVKKMFSGGPITLVGLASSERFDSPDPDKLKQAIEAAKGFMKLSHDIGGSGVRVFPNDFQREVPREKTISQIAKAVNEVGAFARDFGQQVRLEAHGSAGELATLRRIMEQVDQPAVRLKLNSLARDNNSPGFEANFELVKPFLGDTLHLHEVDAEDFPYQQQMNLLVRMGWKGWQLLEASRKVPDRLQALIEQRRIWDGMLAKALGRT